MGDDDAAPRQVSDVASADSAKPMFLAVVHAGTVETKFDIMVFAALYSDYSLCTESEARKKYLRVFSFGQSFTFIQFEDNALVAPMEWTETGADESGTFNIFTASTDNLYRSHTTSHVKYSDRVFEFHTFYQDFGAVFAPNTLMRGMMKVGTPHFERDRLLVWAQLHSLLTANDGTTLTVPKDFLPPTWEERLQKIMRILSGFRNPSQEQEQLRSLCQITCEIGASMTVRQDLKILMQAVREESTWQLQQFSIA